MNQSSYPIQASPALDTAKEDVLTRSKFCKYFPQTLSSIDPPNPTAEREAMAEGLKKVLLRNKVYSSLLQMDYNPILGVTINILLHF
ncbi:MAG: hypothetical protein M3261_07865 [Thermoproteota archaeon]|nr:hypothetical protein [Thermoproteota archaeon]